MNEWSKAVTAHSHLRLVFCAHFPPKMVLRVNHLSSCGSVSHCVCTAAWAGEGAHDSRAGRAQAQGAIREACHIQQIQDNAFHNGICVYPPIQPELPPSLSCAHAVDQRSSITIARVGRVHTGGAAGDLGCAQSGP